MDKYEYRVRVEQIKTLLEKHEYVEAMNVADTVDWRRVKSVSMLCTVSEIYKINRKYEESRDILLLAYERYPGGRMIVYALCELSIKMEEYVQAIEYMKEFVQVAPRDTGIYILRYKLYEAQEVPLEERIEVLEEFKKRDYRERWAYELAYLYHRVGLGTRCVEECDELILWFGEGKYVTKAMELKMLHELLTPEQQAKYEGRNVAQAAPTEYEPKRPMEVVSEESMKAMEAAGRRLAIEQTNNMSQLFGQLPPENAEVSQVINDNEFEVKPVNVSKYSTMNLQAELAKSMQEFLVPENEVGMQEPYIVEQSQSEQYMQPQNESEQVLPMPEQYVPQPTSPMPEQYVPQSTPPTPEQYVPQGLDRQIVFNPSNDDMVERQITGQIHMDDVLKEWENRKQDSANKRKEDARRKALNQTNDLLSQLVGVVPGIVPPVKKDTLEEELKEAFTPKMPEVAADLEMLEESEVSEQVSEIHNKVTEVTGSVIKTAFDAEDKQRALEVTGKIPDIILPSRQTEPIKQDADQLVPIMEDAAESHTVEDGIEEIEEVNQPEELPEESEQPYVEQPILEVPEQRYVEQPVEEVPEQPYVEQPIPEVPEQPYVEQAVEEVLEEEPEEEPEEVKEPEKKGRKDLPSYMTLEGSPKSKRDFNEEERRIFASFDGIEVVKAQIVDVMEDISMDGGIGNVVLMGSLESGRKGLAIDIVRAMQIIDSRFSGKVAKITGKALNKKDIPITLGKLAGGALVIEEAGEITKDNMQIIVNTLKSEIENIVVVLEDTKAKLQPHLDITKSMKQVFNAVIDIPEYSNDDYVSYAKGYAKSLEYVIDEMGVLALYTRIGELQTLDHIASLEEVKEIVDSAIKHVDRKNMSHFMDVLFAKRYDDEDFIILREKDFITKK